MDDSRELKLSLAVCLILSGVYVVYELLATPAGGQPFGHWLGIFGTLLMVATEILYSVRKRTNFFGSRWPVRYWLSVHIFTGIVGPFMVLMHSAFMFQGLAGVTMLLTVLVVGSGFVGRYLYTAIPRSLAGVEASTTDLADEVQQVQASISDIVLQRSAAVQQLVLADASRQRVTRNDWALVFLRAWDDYRYRSRLHGQVRTLERAEQAKLGDVERMLNRRRNLERQMRMLQAARRMMSVWHIAHVPMGVALFSSAAIHVAAEFYLRAGLLR